VSEISITRFQPALAAREKVNSVQAIDDDASLENTQNPLENLSQQKHSDPDQGKQHSAGKRGGDKAPPYDAPDADAVQNRPDDVSMEQVVSRLNDYVQSVKRDIIFDFDPDSGEPSVTVVDRESRKVLRQFDSQEALELARKLDKQERISLFKTQV
jgi:flagellar protein FlaG